MLAPQQANSQQIPSNIGSSEPDGMQGIMSPAQAPVQQPTNPGSGEPDVMPEEGNPDEIIKNLKTHLDQIPDDQKNLLANYLTPETVRVIGIINGPEVAQYLSQFMDKDKVLVPVPRQLAEQHLAGQKEQENQPPQQAQMNNPAQAPAQAGPQPGMMSPPQQATATLPSR